VCKPRVSITYHRIRFPVRRCDTGMNKWSDESALKAERVDKDQERNRQKQIVQRA
jgi:hypothetical protein